MSFPLVPAPSGAGLVGSVTPACLESFLKNDSEQVGMTAGKKDSEPAYRTGRQVGMTEWRIAQFRYHILKDRKC